MRTPPRAAPFAAACALLGVAAGPAAAGAPALEPVTLVVRVEGVESTAGELRVALCDRGLDERGCPKGAWRAPVAGVEEFTFADLRNGRYAVAVYHDANGNGRLDTILGGVPMEPYGFSNDVGRRAPPSFEAATVQIGPASPTVVTVRLRRLLPAT